MTAQDSRPNPDELLDRVKAEEEKSKRGKLKIFLGYAAGVGKTFAMLESALQRMKEVDTVVALVETHGRAETEALLSGLEIIPRKQLDYRGVVLTEMDLDAVLARRPQLAIVDELAHTNADGSRHPKRYQDVEELLDAGIDVYTTLNVQHIESLRDVVSQITGIWVQESVPDNIIDEASEVELVDLPPDELIKRLRQGKVYVPELIGQAIEKFFRKGNLIALRELSMRAAAERVDDQVRNYMDENAIRGPWATSERILVCVGPGMEGTNLVRVGRRVAAQYGSVWFAVHVETPNDMRLSAFQQERISDNLKLAGRLGAKVATIQGNSVAESLSEFAIKNYITKIIVSRSKRRLSRMFRPSTADQVLQLSDRYDVQIVSGSITESKTKPDEVRINHFHFRQYLSSLGIVAVITLVNWVLHYSLAPTVLITFYLIGVVISAVYFGLGPSVMVSIISVLAFDYFFNPTKHSFADIQYTLTLFALIAVGIIISYFTSRLKQQTAIAKRHEQQMTTLYALGRELATLNDLESYANAIVKSIGETFGHNVTIFLTDTEKGGELAPYVSYSNLELDEHERAAAVWSYEHDKQVGLGTDTLPDAKARYIPLTTARGKVGVLAIWTGETKTILTVEQEKLLTSFADLAAVTIEGISLTEKAHEEQILGATEKVQTALLNSISHDLHTPLVSVLNALNSLRERNAAVDDQTRHDLIDGGLKEVDRLNHMLSNLLDMSRIEAGSLMLSLEIVDIKDLIKAALEQVGNRHGIHSVNINLPDNLPYLLVDSGLMIQAFINILDNSFKYSPPESGVDINAELLGEQVEIAIVDHGPGIPPEDLKHVFDKFYRLQRPNSVAGTGLGLSIVKGIIEAHGGTVNAANDPRGGTIIRLVLPVKTLKKGTGNER
jgi:two-component system sensor histidine kinase KdpD